MPETQKIFNAVRQERISPAYAGQRIDNYLMRLLKGVPRSLVYRILRRGEVRVNKGRIRAGYRLQSGDIVRIPPLRLAQEAAPVRPHDAILRQLEQALIYDTPELLVLNKPSGIAVHGGSGLSFGVIEAMRQLSPKQTYLELVHRLDRETSGCLLISKKRSALRILHELLRTNAVAKRYLALVHGSWEKGHMEVDAPLRKNILRSGERIVRVDADGKPARTRFRAVERFANATLVEAELLTGRTHQIRVHAAYAGMPILGDEKYGDDSANRRIRALGLTRLFLHARSLRFRWPQSDRLIHVEAPLDSHLESSLSRLRDES